MQSYFDWSLQLSLCTSFCASLDEFENARVAEAADAPILDIEISAFHFAK
jgi:hypothetical protein